ncbi:MAG: phosphotriesterase [Anaerolineae bacterium]|nr:phosphotriesterase [Anaerolineae bacterium]
MTPGIIRTVTGDIEAQSLGVMLPHEHLFVDLRGPLAPGYAEADPDMVVAVMRPYLAAIEALGVTAFVDCAPVGVGRNIGVLRRLADSTTIHIVAPTGTYKQGFIPASLLDLSVEALAEVWVRELTEGIEGTDSRAGFIKVALSDDGPTAIEVRNLQAAVLASQQTGAVVASHTIGTAAARRELDVLERAGHNLERFIWVHAHTADHALHVEAARRGAWVEFDAVGGESWHPQAALLESVVAFIEAGHAHRLLLSHDAGFYDPSQPDGQPKPDGIRGYTALFEQFIPALKTRGVTDDVIRQITVSNPARAYAIG